MIYLLLSLEKVMLSLSDPFVIRFLGERLKLTVRLGRKWAYVVNGVVVFRLNQTILTTGTLN